MATEKNKNCYGISSRMGLKFHKEIEAIQYDRLKKGKSKDRVSIVKITNLIVRHKIWKEIKENIVSASEEEINQYGI